MGATAAAAAVAYRIGGKAGGRTAEGRPALRILAIGCCAKFGFGGGFAVSGILVRITCIKDVIVSFHTVCCHMWFCMYSSEIE